MMKELPLRKPEGHLRSVEKTKARTSPALQLKYSASQSKQATMQKMIYESAHVHQEKSKQVVLQRKSNNTGLPDQLKNGMEGLSGIALDDVKVHYNSTRPAQLQAYAFAQGNQIHLGPGQEKHLPHEAWHVVQQKQGRVKATLQRQGVNINDNRSLEKEADVMGRNAMQEGNTIQKKTTRASSLKTVATNNDVLQGMFFWNGRQYVFSYQTMVIGKNPLTGQVYYNFPNVPPGFTITFVAQLNDFAVIPIAPQPAFVQQAPVGLNSHGSNGAQVPVHQSPHVPAPKLASVPPKIVSPAKGIVPTKSTVPSKIEENKIAKIPVKKGAVKQVEKIAPDNSNILKSYKGRMSSRKHFFRKDLKKIFSFFTEKELMVLRLVSKYHRDVAQEVIKELYIKYFGFSSELNRIPVILARELSLSNSVMLSAHQITDVRLLNKMLGRRVAKINLGDDKYEKFKHDNRAKVITPIGHGKMHNKFWVFGRRGADGKTINDRTITGSPNFSYNAFNKNIETIVKIQGRQVAGYFKRYFEMMRGTYNSKDSLEMTKMLHFFNGNKRGMKLALAPFINIGDFINGELAGASTVIIRMFIASLLNGKGTGVIENLKKMAGRGTKISIFVDAGQHDGKGYGKITYIERAMHYLNGPNVKIYIQNKRISNNENAIMHDKLILATFPDRVERGRGKDGGDLRVPRTPRTIIGSAGISTNVMSNTNFENMVSIDDKAIFDYFMKHHLKISKDPKNYFTKHMNSRKR